MNIYASEGLSLQKKYISKWREILAKVVLDIVPYQWHTFFSLCRLIKPSLGELYDQEGKTGLLITN